MSGDGVDEAETAARLEAGRLLFAKECGFIFGAQRLDGLPQPTLPEVAFAGRSNVGKSSLINALTGRNTLARTSNTPGRTQQINFFDLGGRLMLVDLPGHGFAQAPKTLVETWTRMVNGYLKGRPGLMRVCLLVDSRHGLKDVDRDVMRMLDQAAVVYQLVLTKADKTKAAERVKLLAAVSDELKRHPAAHPALILTSSETGEGIEALRAELTALALPAPVRDAP